MSLFVKPFRRIKSSASDRRDENDVQYIEKNKDNIGKKKNDRGTMKRDVNQCLSKRSRTF